MFTLEKYSKPIAFYRCLVDLTGSVDAALMLSHALCLSQDLSWFSKTAKEWQNETGLSQRNQETARKNLRRFTFWSEELLGVPAKHFFRVDVTKLLIALEKLNDKGAL